MLHEIIHTRRIEGEPKRRWFTNDFFDLIIWTDECEEIVGFQLSYAKSHIQRALTWHRGSGFFHDRIDDGEGRAGKFKATPILLPDGKFEYYTIAERFKKESRNIDKTISAFVYKKIKQYGEVE